MMMKYSFLTEFFFQIVVMRICKIRRMLPYCQELQRKHKGCTFKAISNDIISVIISKNT